jgi:pyridoxamine 5'-phosphate oxidase
MTDGMGLYDDALGRFHTVFDAARAAGAPEPNAMTLATVAANGRPSARTVLLKGVDERGFVFYTNRTSRKGQHLAVNPVAALCLHWPVLSRQVLIEGVVEQVSDVESDAYFASRPRLSQLGAWASRQSQPLPAPEALATQVAEVEARFDAGPIPRPPHWGGYRLVPDLIEFWSAGDGRLHTRDRYARTADGDWVHGYLNP